MKTELLYYIVRLNVLSRALFSDFKLSNLICTSNNKTGKTKSKSFSADGNYQVTIMTKAKLTYNGTVEWAPPAVYKRYHTEND